MSTEPSYAATLSLRQLQMQVRLGVGEEERAQAQTISMDIVFFMPEPPSAATDEEGGYLCYHEISEKVRALCELRPYKLVEYLAHAVHRLLRADIPGDIKIAVTLYKPDIQLVYAKGGARYSYSDLPPGAWVAPF